MPSACPGSSLRAPVGEIYLRTSFNEELHSPSHCYRWWKHVCLYVRLSLFMYKLMHIACSQRTVAFFESSPYLISSLARALILRKTYWSMCVQSLLSSRSALSAHRLMYVPVRSNTRHKQLQTPVTYHKIHPSLHSGLRREPRLHTIIS